MRAAESEVGKGKAESFKEWTGHVGELFTRLSGPGAFYAAFSAFVLVCLLLRQIVQRRVGAAGWTAGVGFIERWVLTVLLMSMLGFAVLQIVLRNFWDSGLVWIDPLLRHLMLWVGFAGAVVAAGRLRHIQMDVVGRLMPMGPRLWIVRFTTLAAAVICAALARAAWVFLGQEHEFGMTGFLGIPTWILLLALLIGFVMIAVRFAARVITPASELEATLLEAHGSDNKSLAENMGVPETETEDASARPNDPAGGTDHDR